MNRKSIGESVKRKLWAECMGRCMNPDCKADLFIDDSDIIEIAHITAYCKTKDNSFENLIILCPKCHKMFDKVGSIDESMVRHWKKIREEDVKNFFCPKFSSFDSLKEFVVPILKENREIYENYYLKDKKSLWDKFEPQLLINNKKLRLVFENNRSLFQEHENEEYSNLSVIDRYILHSREFEQTRTDQEKYREVLFPEKINSIFGISPVSDDVIQSTESLEKLLKMFRQKDKLDSIILGIENPYILLKDGTKIFLKDTPRLRQLYSDYNCFCKTGVRLDSLNFILRYLKDRNIQFEYENIDSLREIKVNGVIISFIYEYCLSKLLLQRLSPRPDSIIVNLHRWNEGKNISSEARVLAEKMDVRLFTQEEFYDYIRVHR